MRKTNTDILDDDYDGSSSKQRKKLVFSVNYFHARNSRALSKVLKK